MSKIHKLGVIGNPIEHSLSPFIHSRFARTEKINIDYRPYKVTTDNLEAFIKEFFLDKDSIGLNVTLPHKKNVFSLLEPVTEEVNILEAGNTIIKSKNNLMLSSTDGIGLIEDLKKKSISLKNKNILLIGAGGVIESIIFSLEKELPSSIYITNRTIEKADKLVTKYSKLVNIKSYDGEKIDIVVNGSSAGITGDFIKPDYINTHEDCFFYDLNYSLKGTPFYEWALSEYKAKNVFDGTGMLIMQAAHSFKLWFDVFPQTQNVYDELDQMRRDE